MGRNSARTQLREYFLKHVGKKLNWKDLQQVAGGISEWARRVRELRNEEGMNIITDKDRSDLKPGEYMLVDTKILPAFARTISKETRAFILVRNGNTCQMCGAAAGDPDPYNPGRTIRLQIGHIVDKSMGGTDEISNLRALCSNCNEGASNITPSPPSLIKVLAQIRSTTRSDQIAVLKWLAQKFPSEAENIVNKS